MYRDWLSYSQDHQRQRPGNSRSQEAVGKCRPNSGCPAIVCWSDDKDQAYGNFMVYSWEWMGMSCGIVQDALPVMKRGWEIRYGNGQLNGKKNTHKWGKETIAMAIFHCRRVKVDTFQADPIPYVPYVIFWCHHHDWIVYEPMLWRHHHSIPGASLQYAEGDALELLKFHRWAKDDPN